MTIIDPKRNHLSLGRGLFSPVKIAQFPKTVIRYQNSAWAERLGFGDMLDDDEEWANHFARFIPLKGSLKAPLALAYHGHQFGVYNPDLGDGRGVLYAQINDRKTGRLLDLGTKGTGQTPYSRGADGRLTLKGAVREIMATEMLDALGVNTSKTFSVIETGEDLQRHDEPSPTRSAVMVRLSHGHIRIGSFQRLAYQQKYELLEHLLRYSARIYYSAELDSEAPAAELAQAFVREVGIRLADLAAQWMAAGFVHGVLNTDNFNISGESFDYGPWRFLPELDPSFTAAYFDHQGRYAYGRQPEAAFWALCRLADALVGLSSLKAMESAVLAFQQRIATAIVETLCRRLGVDAGWPDAAALTEQLFKALRGQKVGFEAVMFDWFGGEAATVRALASPRGGFYRSGLFKPALDLFAHAPTASEARPDHPYFRQPHPETLLIDEVEAIWMPIAAADDWTLFRDKLAAIHQMSVAYGHHALKPEARLRG
jgi:uncharacterized protein YdiU (UPF0061 family)